MKNDNAIQNDSDWDDESFNLDDLQTNLESQIEEHLSDLSNMELEFEKIGNPNALGDTISTVVWEQFINQIGVENGLKANNEINQTDYEQKTMDDARNDSGDYIDGLLIDKKIIKNDKISFQDARIATDRDAKFVDYKEDIKNKRLTNNSKILDEYTGNIISGSDQHNVDHVIPVKKIHDDKARKFAGIDTKDLANKHENFAVTNENLNKSKKDKTNKEYIEGRSIRESDLAKQLDSRKDKINSSSLQDLDKRHNIEKAEKAYQNKIDAKDNLMIEKHIVAEDKLNQTIKDKIKASTEGKILKVKEQGKVVAKSSLKAVLMGLLAGLVKKIIQKLVSWLASGKKDFKEFLANLKEAISEFIGDLKQHLVNAADTFLTSITIAIFGPIINLVKKAWIFLKQGYKSVKEAIAYIKNPQNKGKSTSVLMLEVGKIVIAGLTVGGALVLGEVIEKSLLTIPGFAFPIPLIGSLASILGIFFGAISSGILGALALNLIDKLIAKKKRSLLTEEIIEKGNQIIEVQYKLLKVADVNLIGRKNNFAINIHQRHEVIKEKFNTLKECINTNDSGRTKNDDNIDELLNILNS